MPPLLPPPARCLSSLLLLLSFLSPLLVSGDSGYCAPFTASGYVWPDTVDEYHSCCGISAAGSNTLKQTGSILNAATVTQPFIACRTGTLTRCCPLISNAPVIVDTTGRSVTYSFQTVTTDSEYRCVAPFSAGGCCDDSDCSGPLASDREWSCVGSGWCESRPKCAYEPFSTNRSIVLFLIPGVLILLELLVHLIGGRLYSFDLTCGGFGGAGRSSSSSSSGRVVQILWFMVRQGMFQCGVVIYFSIAIGGHVWNAIEPKDPCMALHDGRLLECIWSVMYGAILLLLGFACRSRALDHRDAHRDPWQDMILYAHFAHLFPFIWSLYYLPGQSWVDLVLLGQQAIGFRWMWLAIPMWPCMSRCTPTTASPAYSGVFRFVDFMFWRSHLAFYSRDPYTRSIVYNRLRSSSGGLASPGMLFQITSSVPALKSTQDWIESTQECVGVETHQANRCSYGCLKPIRPTYPEYKPQMDLLSPHTAATMRDGPVTARRVAATPQWVQPYAPATNRTPYPQSSQPRARPAAFDFSRGASEGGVELSTIRPQSVLATVDGDDRIVALQIALPIDEERPVPRLNLPIRHHAGEDEEDDEETPLQSTKQPSTASIFRNYPDSNRQPARASPRPRATMATDEELPSARPMIHDDDVHQRSSPSRPTHKPSSAPMLNPWGAALNSARSGADDPVADSTPPPGNPLALGDLTDRNDTHAAAAAAATDNEPPPKQSLRAKRRAAEREKERVEEEAAKSTPRPNQLQPPTPAAAAAIPSPANNRGRVVDGVYVPPATLAVSPKPPTNIEIDYDAAQQELNAADRRPIDAGESAPPSFRVPNIQLPDTP